MKFLLIIFLFICSCDSFNSSQKDCLEFENMCEDNLWYVNDNNMIICCNADKVDYNNVYGEISQLGYIKCKWNNVEKYYGYTNISVEFEFSLNQNNKWVPTTRKIKK